MRGVIHLRVQNAGGSLDNGDGFVIGGDGVEGVLGIS